MHLLLADSGGLAIFVQQLLNGLTTGTLFALIAIGYTMVYGIIELINFAHGDLFMLGAFLALTLMVSMGLAGPVVIAIPLSVAIFASAPMFVAAYGVGGRRLQRVVPGPSWVAGLAPAIAAAAVAFVAVKFIGPTVQLFTGSARAVIGAVAIIGIVGVFCAALNLTVDKIVYKPLRGAPKLTPLVSAIGVSFVFMGVGQLWKGVADINFPDLVPSENLFAKPGLGTELKGVTVEQEAKGFKRGDTITKVNDAPVTEASIAGIVAAQRVNADVAVVVDRGGTPETLKLTIADAAPIRFTWKDLLVLLLTLPIMAGLTLFVKYTKLGKAMRATAQNPTAARLMGIDVDRVIGATFLIGGSLAGAASVIYGLSINTVSFQMGYQNGLYAFTAAVLGGIGNLPGAMLGGILIGLIRSLGSQYVGEKWTSALVFAILIVILVFRPSGLLGARTREKV